MVGVSGVNIRRGRNSCRSGERRLKYVSSLHCGLSWRGLDQERLLSVRAYRANVLENASLKLDLGTPPSHKQGSH